MAITISGENNNDKILASDGVIDQISGFSIVGVVTATSFTGDLTGNVTGNLTGNVTGNINNSTLLLQTGGFERIRIQSDGSVGIGTNSASWGLSGAGGLIVGDGGSAQAITIFSGSSNVGDISFADATSGTARYRGLIRYDHSDNSMLFRTNSDKAVLIDSTGRVLIGVDAATNNDSYVQAFKSSGNEATITVGNVATSSSGLCRYDFAPSNKVVGSRIECHATEDFSSTANRTADLVFITRKDGTLSEKFRITSAGLIRMGNGAAANTEASITAAIFQNVTGTATVLKLGNTNTPSSANNRAIEFCDGTGGTEGSSKYTYARIKAERAGGSNSGRLIFSTKPNNNDGPQKAIEITPDGDVLIGNGGVTTQEGDGRLIVYANTRLHPAIKADCIDGGSNRANGFTMLADNYGPDESLTNIGLAYSGAGLVISRGVKVSNASDNVYLSSTDTAAQKPTAFKLDYDGSFRFLNTNTSATTTTDSAVTLTERLRITSNGRVGIATDDPKRALHVNDTVGGGIAVNGASSGIQFGLVSMAGASYNAILSRAGTNDNHITGSTPRDLCLAPEREGAFILGLSPHLGAMTTGVHISRLRNFNIYYAGDFKLNTGDSGSATERLRIDSNGRLIIGGSSAGPYHQDGDEFNIYSAGNTGMSIFSGTSSLGSLFFADDNNDVHGQRRGAIQYNHNGNYLALWTNAGEKLRIASDGSLTSTANNNGQIIHTFKNDNTTAGSSAQTVEHWFRFNRTGGGMNHPAAKIVAGKEREWIGGATNQDGYLAFYTTLNENGGAERLRITSGGRVNIGGNYTQTTAPLCVTTSANSHGIRLRTGSNTVCDILNNDNSGNCEIRGYYNNNSGTQGEGFRIESNGNTFFSPAGSNRTVTVSNAKFGVSENELYVTSSASYATHFNYQNNGSHYISCANTGAHVFRNSSSGGTLMRIMGSGGIGGGNSTTNIYNPSDERLKENMVELTNGLDKIKKLKPYSFTWKKGFDENLDGVTHYGFGANQAKTVDEKLVEKFIECDIELNGETIKDPLRVNEKHVIPLLVKAIQEQQEQIETLKSEVAALKGS